MCGFGCDLDGLHLADADGFLQLGLEALDELVIAEDFRFESVVGELVGFDLLESGEIFLFVGLVLLCGVLVLTVCDFKFLVQLGDIRLQRH